MLDRIILTRLPDGVRIEVEGAFCLMLEGEDAPITKVAKVADLDHAARVIGGDPATWPTLEWTE